MDEQWLDDPREPIYNSSVPIHDVALENSWGRWVIEENDERGELYWQLDMLLLMMKSQGIILVCIYTICSYNQILISCTIPSGKTFPTQSCLVLYSFCVSLLHSNIIWLIVSSVALNNLVEFYGILTIMGFSKTNPLYTYILNIYDLVRLGFMTYQTL